jgi:hypothetical protein
VLVYSHIWDALLKLASIFALIIIFVTLHLQEQLENTGLSSGAATFFFVVITVAVWIPLYRQVLSTLAAWLYANVNLGAGVSFSEARQLARLFQLDLSFKWIPLKEVRRLPRPQRKDALLTALNGLAPHRKAMFF